MLLLVPRWLGAGTSVWQCTVGRLNCNQNLLAVTGADALLRPSTATTSTLGMCQPSLSALPQRRKSTRNTWCKETSLIVTNACEKCPRPKITHTKHEKFSELRIFFTNKLLDWRMAFHRKHPLWYSQSEGTYLLSCQTDLMYLFPAFPSCWNLKRSAMIYLWHASEKTLLNPPMAHLLHLCMTAGSSS